MNYAHMLKDIMERLFTGAFFMQRERKVKTTYLSLTKEWKTEVYSYNRMLSAIKSNKTYIA